MPYIPPWPDALELMGFFNVEPRHWVKYDSPVDEPFAFTVARDGLELEIHFDPLESIVDIVVRRVGAEIPLTSLELLGAQVRLEHTSKGQFLQIDSGIGLDTNIAVEPDIKVTVRASR